MSIVRDPSAREKRDQHVLQLYKAGLPVHEISAAAHLSRRGVYDILAKYGVAKTRPSGRPPDLIRDVEITELRARGMPCKQIAQLRGMSPTQVSVVTRTRAPLLHRSTQRQLLIEKVVELHRQGKTPDAIAEQLGIPARTVRRFMHLPR